VTFAHPLLAAAAVASVALPILIHLLLRFRRRPQKWAAMRFLMEAYQRQRKRLRLQQIILLAVRCLLLLVAGAAIARPMAGGAADASGPRDVYLLLDNSLTAQLRPGAGDATALERHVERARETLRALGPGDRAGVVLLASPAEGLIVPATGDRSAVAASLDALAPTDAAADLEGALAIVRDAIERDGASARTRIVVLSELREGAFADGQTPAAVFADAPPELVIAGMADQAETNVRITEVEPQRTLFLGAGERTTVRVTLRRSGPAVDTEGATTVRIAFEPAGEGEPLLDAGRASATWAAGQTETEVFVSVQIPSGAESFASLRASIDRDRLAGDDVRRAPLAIAESVRVGVIDRTGIAAESTDPLGGARWLSLALEPDRSSRLTPVPLDPSDIDIAALADLDAVFLLRPDLLPAASWEALAEFVRRGRSLAIFPPPGADAHAWTAVAAEALGYAAQVGAERLEFDPPRRVRPGAGGALLRLIGGELEELAAPVRVFSALEIALPPGEGEALLTREDGAPWIVRAGGMGPSAGEVLLFASAPSLEWTTLPATPLMVPLVQELVRQSAGAALRQRVYVAGRPVRLPPGVRTLTDRNGSREIAVAEARPAEPVRESGLYLGRGARGETLGPAIFVADAAAGETAPVGAARAREWFAEAGLEMDRDDETPASGENTLAGAGLGVSGTLLLIALALAALETVLSRRFSPRGAAA
jgi:hypothetical protein